MKLSKYKHIIEKNGYSYWYNGISHTYFRLSVDTGRKLLYNLQYLDDLKAEYSKLYNKLTDGGFMNEDPNSNIFICGIYCQAKFPMKIISAYVTEDEPAFDQLSVKFRPDKHWELGASWAYMFDKRGWHHTAKKASPQQTGVQAREMRNTANMVSLEIAYNLDFGSPFKKSMRDRVIDLKDNGRTFNDYGK